MVWVGRDLVDHSHRVVGLEGTLWIAEPYSGWVGRDLTGHGMVGLDWKGSCRSQIHRMVGLEGILLVMEP